ncbi:receptor kinase-like protein Xa21 [Asparagus officinalis]|nr:receptor kinase-like protein Xa21 [Asparagus officinalis]
MSGNLLTGTVPSEIGMLQNLQLLHLHQNRLRGLVPNSIGNLTELNELVLNDNRFEGSVPMAIENLSSLSLLDLSRNKLNGTIPGTAISKLHSLTQGLNLSSNLLTGSLPMQIDSLINLVALDVSENRLSGEIPSSLGACQLLGRLFMQGNYFEGNIPLALSRLAGIEELDLSHNNLSGPIPEFLGGFRLLHNLNLSFNDFQGPLPDQGVFRNASALSVTGNNKLCGGDPQFHLQQCDAVDGATHRSSHHKVIIPVVVACTLAILLCAAYYIRRRGMKPNPPNPSLKESFLQISYAEIQKATAGFSASSLIGAGSFGSVYKGVMDSDPNQVVAIKVLNLEQQGAYKSFMAECDSLRVIRHRNLINIVTICSSIDHNGNDFKALIFEYMPNGSLDDLLHPQAELNEGSHGTNSKHLSLVQRLNIVVDVALALDYLHHQCQTPIVHCDLKPSNVLLGYDMTARVCDFGLSRFLHRTISSSSETNSTIGLKGSIGYIPPEYGMGGTASTQGDVYSFGVLLLETFTGKRPTDKMFQNDLNLHKYVEMAYPDQLLDIIDPSVERIVKDVRGNYAALNTTEQELIHEGVLSIFRIGLLCSQASPNERIEMGDVINELILVKKTFDGLEPKAETSN